MQTLRLSAVVQLFSAALLAAAAPALRAQGTPCPGGSNPLSPAQISQDACQKAQDLFAFMAPQLGASMTGGNLILGSGGPLGGLGHFSVGLRANIIRGQLPQTDGVTLSASGRQASDFRPNDQVLGLPSAEAAVGLFRGIPLGVTNVLGVDALVSAFYVPEIEQDDFRLTTDGGGLRVGYGVRVGVLQETAIVPGVSLGVMRRELPTVSFGARLATGDSVRVNELKASATSWRASIAKRFLLFGFTAGAGQDRYDASAATAAYVAPRRVSFGGISADLSYRGPIANVEQKLTRTNVFGGLSLNLPGLRLAAEFGRVSGGNLAPTFNTFGDRRADDAYAYGSLGVRFQR